MISTNEEVQVQCSDGSYITANAILDTGNSGCTLITHTLASRLGLIDSFGDIRPLHDARRTITIQGVVPGAMANLPMLWFTYRLKGKEVCVAAALSDTNWGGGHHDVLISRAEIAEFERYGYRFSAGAC